MIVLDTHVWWWWLSMPAKVPRKATRAIEKAAGLGISAITPWELAMKAESGALRFDRPYDVWIDDALAADPRFQLLALSPRVAGEAARLPWDHRDPADRFIVATARVHEATLITADSRILSTRLVRTAWA